MDQNGFSLALWDALAHTRRYRKKTTTIDDFIYSLIAVIVHFWCNIVCNSHGSTYLWLPMIWRLERAFLFCWRLCVCEWVIAPVNALGNPMESLMKCSISIYSVQSIPIATETKKKRRKKGEFSHWNWIMGHLSGKQFTNKSNKHAFYWFLNNSIDWMLATLIGDGYGITATVHK